MRGVNILLSLIVTCIFASSTFAQAPIKKPEKKKQDTTTTTTATQQKPKTGTSISPHSSSSSTSKNPKLTSGIINGHEWVDLGLSAKWATCNVGASSPSDYGNYYAWGETSTKSEYTTANSKTYGKSMGNIAGNSQYDAARANWGGTWRMPTASEIDELINKCKRTWTTQGGHNGYKITGPNGNSIFLPAAGWRAGTSLYDAGVYGGCWSATPYDAYSASALYFVSGAFNGVWDSDRYYGLSVRPVSE